MADNYWVNGVYEGEITEVKPIGNGRFILTVEYCDNYNPCDIEKVEARFVERVGNDVYLTTEYDDGSGRLRLWRVQ